MIPRSKRNLLIVGNFAAETGYAWDTISEYFVALGKMVSGFGASTFVCYPEIGDIPARLRVPELKIIKLDFSSVELFGLFIFLRRNRIYSIYLTDRPVLSFKYLVCRLAGVRSIIAHDRTSGDRSTPGLIKGLLKSAVNRLPLVSADVAVAISEFVKDRLARVNRFPDERIVRIWNGVDVKKFRPGRDTHVYRKFGIPQDSKIVFSCSRANRYKGIQILIEAANILVNHEGLHDLYFLYCGDGPDLGSFREMINQYGLDHVFLCPGKTGDIDHILRGVSIVVVPSIWQEGFGLSVVEGMAAGRAVIASRVGGIPEIIDDGKNGILFPPGDAEMLARKIHAVADDELLREGLGRAARETAVRHFNLERQKEELVDLFRSEVMSCKRQAKTSIPPSTVEESL